MKNWGNLTIDNMIIKNNAAFGGGGIANDSGCTLQITNSTIHGNTAQSSGGGGIENAGNAIIKNSTISNNTASGLNAGGGLNNLSGATVNLTNVTISGNSANNGNALANSGTAQLINSTLAYNTSSNAYSVAFLNYGTATFQNTLIAENDNNPSCDGTGTFTSMGNNMESGDSCNFKQVSDHTSALVKIKPLGDYGGITQTVGLKHGCPAIDAGNNGACPTTDQRGYTRPLDGNGDGTLNCDIGAFEFDPSRDSEFPWHMFLPALSRGKK